MDRAEHCIAEQHVSAGRRIAEWIAFLIVVLAVVGFSLSSPRFASPDEEAHQATAWYVTEYGMPPKAEDRFEVPTIFRDGACFATNGRQDASCMPAREGGYTELSGS